MSSGGLTRRNGRGVLALCAGGRLLGCAAALWAVSAAAAACPVEMDLPYSPDDPPGPTFAEREKLVQLAAGAQLVEDIHLAYASGADSFTIPPGDYRYSTDYAIGANSFALQDLDREGQTPFRIQGYGATLWFDLRAESAPQVSYTARLINCRNVTLEGVTMDCDPRWCMDARATAFDFAGNRIQVEPLEGAFLLPSVPVHQNRFIPFKPNGRHIPALYRIDNSWGPGAMYYDAFTVDADGKYWLEMDTTLLLDTIQDPTWQATYGAEGTLEVGDLVSCVYSAVRGIHLNNCKQVTVRDLNAYVGLLFEDGYCDNQWIDCRFISRPGTNVLMGGGGTLNTACECGSTFDGFVSLRTTDDPFNIRAWRYDAVSVTADSITFNRDLPPLVQGDKADMFELGSKDFIAQLTVDSVQDRTVAFQEPVGAAYATSTAILPRFQNAGWTIRNSLFIDCYQRLLLQCGPGLFENNRVERLGSVMRIHPGTAGYVEGGVPDDLIFRDNVFVDSAVGPPNPVFHVNGEGRPLRNLTIVDNLFCNMGREAVDIELAEGAIIRDNIVINPFEGAALLPETDCPDLPAFRLDEVDGADIVNNTIVRRTAATGVTCEIASTNVDARHNLNVTDSNETLETLVRALTGSHERSARAIVGLVRAELLQVPLAVQAEDGALNRAVAADAGGGWNGTGYVDLGEGGYVECVLDVSVAADFDLRFRVAGAAVGMAAAIVVNGETINAGLACPDTGSWDSSWQVVVQPGVALHAGANTIRFADAGASQPQLDQIEIAPSPGQGFAGAPGDCDCDGYVLVDPEGVGAIACVGGPDAAASAGCGCGDADGDGDVDLADLAAIQASSVAAPPS